MKINEELFAELKLQEEQRKREDEYIRLCLDNMICPNCNKIIEVCGINFTCKHCGGVYHI